MPSERTVVCPKCGSDDLIEWGSDMRMCRRCHETFVAGQCGKVTQEIDSNQASARAQALLKELESRRLVGGATEAERKNVLPKPVEGARKNEPRTVTIETQGSGEQESSEDVLKEFEELFKESSSSPQPSSYSDERREEPQRIYRSREQESQERVAVAQAQISKPKKNKTAGCIVAGAVIAFWILMMIICSVLGK